MEARHLLSLCLLYMGNDLESWRASIGHFYCRSIALRKYVFKNIQVSWFLELFHNLKNVVNLSYFLFICFATNSHYIYIIAMLLLLSGDIEMNPGPIQADSSLSILHLNIRSIRHKLKYIFETLSDHDILCFTESHLDDTVTNTHLLSECSCFNLYRRDITAHSGGIVVYVSKGLFCQRRLDLESLSVQSVWLEVRFKTTCFFIMCYL